MRFIILIFSLCLFSTFTNANVTTVTVGDGGNFFFPASVTINPGDTIRWIWVDGHHNVSGYSLPTGAPALYGSITSLDTVFEYVPVVSGLYKYTCTHHSGMDGTFFVSGCSYPSKPVINANDNSGCMGDTLILSTAVQTGVTYQWINGASIVPSASNDSLKVVATGLYKVIVNRCGMDSVSEPFPVTIQNPPAALFTYTSEGLHFTFNSTSVADSYLWTFSDGSPTQHTPQASITFGAPGIYTVSLRTTALTSLCSDSFSAAVVAELPAGIRSTEMQKISLYPNPADRAIRINCQKLQSVVITDIYGRSYMLPFRKDHQFYEIRTDQLPEGFYYVKLFSDKDVNKISVWIRH